MDPQRFDTLAKALSAPGTRRGLATRLAAIAIAAGWRSLGIPDDATGRGNGGIGSEGGGRRQRRKARHRHQTGNNKEHRKGKRKGKGACTTAGKAPKKGHRCCAGLSKDAAGRCAQPLPCGTGGPCLVFATSQKFTGNLGGLAGADKKCQALATAPGVGLPGTYKAWLSDSSNSPFTRFVKSPGPYQLVTGEKVADNWNDLTTCDGSAPFACLDRPINITETGDPVDLFERAWTFTLTDGTAGKDDSVDSVDYTCQNWTNDAFVLDCQTDPSRCGSAGEISSRDGEWTDESLTVSSCDFEFGGGHLYCFQQS